MKIAVQKTNNHSTFVQKSETPEIRIFLEIRILAFFTNFFLEIFWIFFFENFFKISAWKLRLARAPPAYPHQYYTKSTTPLYHTAPPYLHHRVFCKYWRHIIRTKIWFGNNLEYNFQICVKSPNFPTKIFKNLVTNEN